MEDVLSEVCRLRKAMMDTAERARADGLSPSQAAQELAPALMQLPGVMEGATEEVEGTATTEALWQELGELQSQLLAYTQSEGKAKAKAGGAADMEEYLVQQVGVGGWAGVQEGSGAPGAGWTCRALMARIGGTMRSACP